MFSPFTPCSPPDFVPHSPLVLGNDQHQVNRRHPIFDLPIEIVAHVFSLCELHTLTILARVNILLFELVAPLIYVHVELVGLRMVQRFFRPRQISINRSPEVDRILSLCQTRTLNITEIEGEKRSLSPSIWDEWSFNWDRLSSDRLPSSRPLPLETLTIVTLPGCCGSRLSGSDCSNYLAEHLLPLFDPRHLHLRAVKPPGRHPHRSYGGEQFFDNDGALNISPISTWSRLRSITITGVALRWGCVHDGFGGRLPSASAVNPRPPLVLEFDLRPGWGYYTSEMGTALASRLVGARLFDTAPGVAAIVVRVGSEEDVERVKELLLDSDRVVSPRLVPLREKLQFEVIPEGGAGD